MASDTQEEKDYWSLLESTQRQAYPGFVDQLSAQVGPLGEVGRAAVIEFEDGAKPSVRRFHGSGHLRRYLDKPFPANDLVHRRAFVLQGLPRKLIQVLGSRLEVPPSLFAAHWAGPGFHNGILLNRTPRHYDNQNRFIVISPKLHRAKINELEKDKPEPIYYMVSSIHRQLSRLTVFGDFEGPLLSFERLSFWSVCKGKSWNVILLVDPPLDKDVRWRDGDLRSVDHSDSIELVDSIIDNARQMGSWYAPYNLAALPPPSTAGRRVVGQLPDMQSLFEDILHLYPLEQYQSTTDPRICTDICRKLVLSAWTAWLRVVEAQITQEQYIMSTGETPTGINTATWLDKSWTQPWQARKFSRLIRAKFALEAIDADLYYNMDALGIGAKSKSTEDWEAEAWRSLQNAVHALKTKVDIILQAYTQAVSVQESITSNQQSMTSNKQARQVGYLTSLATLFIPVSLIAAIFSMGGEFSAGASLFWVYWAISIPIVIAGCTLLFTKLGGRVLGHAPRNESLV